MSRSDHILKIIGAVKAQECIWNAYSNDYGKRDKLEKAWKEVANEVGQDEIYCRDKWRNVRTGFLRSIQAYIPVDVCKTFDETFISKRKRFYLHEEMKFLLPSAEKLHSRKPRKSSTDTSYMKEAQDDITNHSKIINPDTKLELIQIEDNDSMDFQRLEAQSINSTSEYHILTNSIDASTNVHNSEYMGHIAPNSIVRDQDPSNILLHETHNQQVTKQEETKKDCDEWEERQLLYFFQSNLGDVLSLSKNNQRLFKLRMLAIIDELHHSENT